MWIGAILLVDGIPSPSILVSPNIPNQKQSKATVFNRCGAAVSSAVGRYIELLSRAYAVATEHLTLSALLRAAADDNWAPPPAGPTCKREPRAPHPPRRTARAPTTHPAERACPSDPCRDLGPPRRPGPTPLPTPHFEFKPIPFPVSLPSPPPPPPNRSFQKPQGVARAPRRRLVANEGGG